MFYHCFSLFSFYFNFILSPFLFLSMILCVSVCLSLPLDILQPPALCSYGILSVRTSMSMHLFISCTFSQVLFILFVSCSSDILVFVLSYFIFIFQKHICFLMKDRKAVDMNERECGGNWQKNHNQCIISYKIYFQLKLSKNSQTFKIYNACIFSTLVIFSIQFLLSCYM